MWFLGIIEDKVEDNKMSQEATGTEFAEDLAVETRTTKGRNGRKGKVVQTTRREFIDDDDEDKVQLPGILALADVEEHSIVRLRVWRKDPDEGMLGYLEDVNSSEEEISQRWGGGQFRVDGLNQSGHIKASRTFRLAGDPIFVSNGARVDYERRKGIPSTTAVVGQPQGMSMQEILAMTQKLDDDRRKAEDERRAREAAERRDHEERMRRLEVEADDRRRKDERERDEKRRADENEREERRRREQIEAENRSRAHLDQTIAMMRAQNEQTIALVKQQIVPAQDQGKSLMEAVKMITVIKEAFGGEAATPEESDPLSLLMKHGHEWLNGIGNAVSSTIREVKGGGAPPQVVAHPSAPQLPAGVPPEGITIPASSPLAGKLQHLAQTIAASGRNPEEELSKIVDNLTATIEGKPAPHQPGARPANPNAFVPTPESVASPPPPPAAAPEAVATAAPVTPEVPKERSQIERGKTARGSARISFT